MPQLVILAGGKGTRLASLLQRPDGTVLPKPLVMVNRIPLLERQICHAVDYGLDDIVILVNHQAATIETFCAQRFSGSARIRLIDDGEPRGTAGAVLAVLAELDDNFCVMYGDTLLNVDLDRFHTAHVTSGADVTLFAHPNDHPKDSDLLEVDERERITHIHPYPHPKDRHLRNLVNAALYFVRKSALEPYVNQAAPLDFAKDLFPLMLEKGQTLQAYISPEYIKDIGTPERLERGEHDIHSGRFAAQCLKKPQRTVFLDRDGVINEERGHISSPDNFVLLPGATHAIQRLNHAGLLVVVVTNQPVIARGECSEAGLREIHNTMETLLGEGGAYIDRLYHCPHHPHKGYEGERPELKIACSCRKPQIGLLVAAQKDLNCDFAASWFVGDRTTDIMCAKNSGLQSILVKTGEGGNDGVCDITADFETADLQGAVDIILTHGLQSEKLA